MTLEDQLLKRVGREFSHVEQATVVELLSRYAGREADRVRWDILNLSKGDLTKVREYVEAAQIGYRDILYWAEYFHDDPMLRGRDPRQLVDKILVQWGDGKRRS